MSCDSGLVDYRFLKAVLVEWACILVSAVACLIFLSVGSSIVVVAAVAVDCVIVAVVVDDGGVAVAVAIWLS